MSKHRRAATVGMLGLALSILWLTMAAKVFTLWAASDELRSLDLLLPVSKQMSTLFAVMLEMVAMITIILARPAFLKGIVALTVGIEFLWYHGLLSAFGYTGSCGCIGHAWKWFGMDMKVASSLSTMLGATLALLGAAVCWIERKGNAPQHLLE